MRPRWGCAAALAAVSLAAAARGGWAQEGGAPTDSDTAAARAAVERREAQREPVSVLAGPVDPAAYRLGPGDGLLLHVRGPINRDVPLEIGPEGTVLVPDEGLVGVAGRTLADVRADLLRRLQRHWRNVEVEIQLSRPRTFRVYLTGMVRSPGPAISIGSFRVADVLTTGMLVDGASRRNIQVIHTDRTSDPADLDLFLQTGDPTWNPWLRDGDVIQVPASTRFVHVEGAVARPGLFELGQRDSLRTLLRLAGDPVPAADPHRLLVIRFTGPTTPESLWVSLDDVLAGRVNPPVDDRERLYVYFLPRYRLQQQASVSGEVQRPGTYPIVEGHTRLSDLLAAAGGFQSDADLSSVRLHRASAAAGEKDEELDRLLRLSRGELTASEYEVLRTKLAGLREDFRVDWARLGESSDLDVLLRDGDQVRVDRLVSSVRVEGEVRRPGLVNYVAGRSVDDCIAQAGGFTNRAWRGKVRVTRAVTGQTLLAKNVRTLDPGDLVWVPEKSDITQWDLFRDTLTAVAQIATIVIAIRSLR